MLPGVASKLPYYLVSSRWLLGASIVDSSVGIESTAGAGSNLLFPDDKVRLALQPGIIDKRIFANIFENFASLPFFFLPFRDVVVGLLLLETLQELLILSRYFDEFSFPCFSVQTLLVYCAHRRRLDGHLV